MIWRPSLGLWGREHDTLDKLQQFFYVSMNYDTYITEYRFMTHNVRSWFCDNVTALLMMMPDDDDFN